MTKEGSFYLSDESEAAGRELLVVDDGDGGTAADDGRRRLVGRQERAEASLLAPELALQLDVVGRVSVEVVAQHRREPGLRVAEAAEVGAVPFARLALDQMKGDPERSGSLFLSIALKKDFKIFITMNPKTSWTQTS